MFMIKAAFCRVFQTAFRLALPLLPYREPQIIGSPSELPEVFRKEKRQSVLIVTGKGIAVSGLIAPVEKVLRSAGIAYIIYDQTQPNPTVGNVEAALALYREQGCDSLIAIGGGSAMDCAKGVGARIAYPQKTLRQMKGVLRVLRRLPTLIAIPTTAGTGSEVTLAAVITDSERRDKYALMSFPLIPHYAVLDAYGKSAHRKLHTLGVAAGVCSEHDSHQAGAEKFIQAIRKLNAQMNIPEKLAGIRQEDIPALAKHAEKEANPLYPVPKLMTARELEDIYRQVADWSMVS